VGLVLIGALVLILNQPAWAQAETPPEAAPAAPGRLGHGCGCGQNLGPVEREAAATALGMTADELSTQLWGGRSLAELAEKAGVDLQAVQEAVVTARQAAQKEALQQAVSDGKITQEQADWLLQGLDKGYLGKGSMMKHLPGGQGGGWRGGRFGLHRFAPPASPPTEP
jgi:hypothetical protein